MHGGVEKCMQNLSENLKRQDCVVLNSEEWTGFVWPFGALLNTVFKLSIP
jgi:hypothetical protein